MKNPFQIPSTPNKPFPPRIFSLETSIVGEAQEQLRSWITMAYSPILRGLHVDKGMVILHL